MKCFKVLGIRRVVRVLFHVDVVIFHAVWVEVVDRSQTNQKCLRGKMSEYRNLRSHGGHIMQAASGSFLHQKHFIAI